MESKKTGRASASTTGLSSTAEAAPSSQARAVSAVGREIEAALGVERSGDVLTRWMAFRLAEVRSAVDSAPTAEARKAALSEHDSLIMALWAQRGTLPEPLGVDRRTGLASRIIQQFVSDPCVWKRPDKPRNAVEVLGALRDQWAHLLSEAAVLIYKREAIALGPEDLDLPLTDEERESRKEWGDLAESVLRNIRMHEGPLYRDPELSDAEAVVKLELATGKTIEAMRAYLDTLETMLGLTAATPQSKNPRRARKRD